MCDDLVPVGDPRHCNEYPIEILFCDRCVTAHQRFQIPKSVLFPPTYHYRSRHTADVLNGMCQLVSACEVELGQLKRKMVLDIGCNDGSLLSIFGEKEALTFGIEPTAAAKDAVQRGHVVIQDFLTESVASDFVREHGPPDIITFTNVFAHIEDLRSIISALKILASSKTMLVIENHYLGSVLAKNQFDTFYHEHPRTYSYTSFAYIAEALGGKLAKVEFPKRYGGNIRVFLTVGGRGSWHHDNWGSLHAMEGSFGDALEHLASRIERWRLRKRADLESEFRRYGRLEAKAFPGRAAIPVKVLGLDETLISAVYEKSESAKVGHYVPGTRIPICSDDDFSPRLNADRPLLNLAWHIADEIKSYVRDRGFEGRIIDIVSQEDFLESS
jgi:C-methyltransferase C-terminal domain/Methyltransferase domain